MDSTDWQIVRSALLFGTVAQDVAQSLIGNQLVTVPKNGRRFSYHLKSLVEQIEHIKLLSPPQRLADFLLRLALVREGGCTIELP